MTDIEATRWAVALGCSNAHKLAEEWGMSLYHASRCLEDCAKAGRINRLNRGHYSCKPMEMS